MSGITVYKVQGTSYSILNRALIGDATLAQQLSRDPDVARVYVYNRPSGQCAQLWSKGERIA